MDGMSIKELVQFDAKWGRCFGFVDWGGTSNGDDVPTNECLEVMVVGLRSFWKLPVAYFLVKGVQLTILRLGSSARQLCTPSRLESTSERCEWMAQAITFQLLKGLVATYSLQTSVI